MYCGVGEPIRSFSSSVGCIFVCGGLVWSVVACDGWGVGDRRVGCGAVVREWNTGWVMCLFRDRSEHLAETLRNA